MTRYERVLIAGRMYRVRGGWGGGSSKNGVDERSEAGSEVGKWIG